MVRTSRDTTSTRAGLTRVIEEGLQLRLRANATAAPRRRARLPVFRGRAAWWQALIRSATRPCSKRWAMTPDVNVLVAASRTDHPHHAVARAWLEATLDGGDTGTAFTLMPMVLASFLRLVSSPKIFKLPTPVDEAIRFVDALLDGGAHLAQLGPEWPRLRQLCLEQQLAGNDPPDAWLAAATMHLAEHLVSFDRDFKRLLGRNQFTLLEPGPA